MGDKRTDVAGEKTSVAVEDRVTDEDRETLPTEWTSEECDIPVCQRVGVSPPNAEATCRDWEHLGG